MQRKGTMTQKRTTTPKKCFLG